MAIDNRAARSTPTKKKKAGFSQTGVIVIAVISVLSGGAYFYWSSGALPTSADDVEKNDALAGQLEAIYLNLDPSFIVNFVYKDTLRYLQANISVMARDQSVIDQVSHHMPVIRDRILTLLSNKTYAELSGSAHKEKLRLQMLLEIREIVGISKSGHSVDTVYFTGYVMQ